MAEMNKQVKPTLKPEQRQAIEHESGNIIVSASAGSGKTFVMIERIIRLLKEKKARVNEILATTFTEASAEDMKRKLFVALSSLAEETNDKDFCEQLLEVQSASVCTIDSFSANLLREYFFKVNLSPDFRIADQTDSGLLKLDAIKKTFKEFYKNKDKNFLSFIDKTAVSRKDLALRESVIRIHDMLSCEVDRDSLLNKSLSNCTKEGYKNIKHTFLERFKTQAEKFLYGVECVKAKSQVIDFKGLVKHCDKLIELYENAPHFSDIYECVSPLLKMPSMFGGKMPEDENAPLLKAELTTIRNNFKKELSAIQSAFVSPEVDENRRLVIEKDTKVLVELVRAFTKHYDELKREENVLDFADLERFVLELLNDEETTLELKKKYKYIFVDECQDLNAVQSEILNRLSNNNTFMVGDVKQSIYGFRGSKPEIFDERFSGAKARGESAITLNCNFRCAQNIIDAVNMVFSFAMTEKTYGSNYFGNAELVAGGVYPENCLGRVKGYRLKKAQVEKEEVPKAIYDILSTYENGANEVSAIAKLINKIISEETLNTYYDYKSKEFKNIKYSDILILSRDKSSEYVRALLRGLNAFGIPVQSTSKDNVLNYLEIRVLCAVLELINDFSLDIPLAVLLKSPIGKLTDDDFAVIAQFDYTNLKERPTFDERCAYYLEKGEDESIKQKLNCFYSYFKQLRFDADFMSASEIIEKVVEDFCFEAYYAIGQVSEEVSERIRFFISVLGKGVVPYTCSQVLKLIANNERAFEKEFSAGKDAVSVMTMHASKGLEYPVVIVCGLQKSMNKKDESEKFLKDETLGIAINYYDELERRKYSTPHRELIKIKKGIDRVKEELRLLYVALTRAKYSLYAITEEVESSKSAEFEWANRMIDYFPLEFKFEEITETELNFESRTQKTGRILVGEKNITALQEVVGNLEFKYNYSLETELPLKSTVTELVKSNQPETQKIEKLFSDCDTKTDTERGVIAHKFLELYDFSAKRSATCEGQRFIEKGLMSKEELQKIGLEKIDKALSSTAFSGIENKGVYREKSFLANFTANELYGIDSQENVLVQGVIDLLLVSEDGLEIIDYKYSNKSSENLLKTYEKQLNLYALAVERATGKKVKSKTILSLLNGESVAVK